MKFKAGNSYELPVKERIVQGNSQYFIVEHDGVEYRIRLYDFKKSKKTRQRCCASPDRCKTVLLRWCRIIRHFWTNFTR